MLESDGIQYGKWETQASGYSQGQVGDNLLNESIMILAAGSRKVSSSQRTARIGLGRLRESKEAHDIKNTI